MSVPSRPKLTARLLLVLVAVGLQSAAARADEPADGSANRPDAVPAGGPFRKPACPVVPAVPVPPGGPCTPCPPYPPLPPLPPISPPQSPTDPTRPPQTTPDMQPEAPGATPPATPAADNGGSLAQATQGGTSAFQTNAPNLFGDFLGSRTVQVTVPGPSTGVLNGGQIIGAIPYSSLINSSATSRTVNLQNTLLTVTNGAGQAVFQSTPFALALSRTGAGQFTETYPTPTVGAPLVNAVYQYISTPNGTLAIPAGVLTPAQTTALQHGLAPLQGSLYQFASAYEHLVNPKATLTQFSLGGVTAAYNPAAAQLQYVSQITSVISAPVVISVPNPGSGGSVGLQKLSEDNNPLPRDRIIFNYDYFSNTPQGNFGGPSQASGGVPVNRYQFGFEKTFFDGRTSFEVRIPFASTLDHDLVEGTQTRNTEFGNLRLAFKALLLRQQMINVSGGLGVYLPTANSVTVRAQDSTELVHISNTSVQLSPYAAVLFTPNERFFAQSWVQWTFDTGGNAVQVNPDFFNGNSNIGALRAATTFAADLQIGYWFLRSAPGLVRGFAPFVELHYNGNINRGNVLAAGNNTTIGNADNFEEFNISAGVITLLNQNSTLSVGAASPLRTAPNRTFDYQIGVRLNWYFGYTARQQSLAARVNSF
jgi:hypothetical protein